MKPFIAVFTIVAAIIMSGCSAVGVLEEENTELQNKVDSLNYVQHKLNERVEYLESENVHLDSRNKQLNERISETGALTPPKYTVTSEKPREASPATAVPLQQHSAPQPERVQTVPSTATTNVQQPIPAQPKAAPWRAERQALQSGAANPELKGKGNWAYGSGSGRQASGYTYNNDNGSYPGETQPGWDYNDKKTPGYTSKYSEKFDRHPQPGNEWNQPRERGPQPRRNTVPAIPGRKQPAPVQRRVERPEAHTARIPLPPAHVDVSPAEAARKADYSYLATYQKGLAAYKDGDYSECIQVLSGLSRKSAVNNTSDNCDFWIAESYYMLGEHSRAQVYYSRVLSYPSSDKAAAAQARLKQIP